MPRGREGWEEEGEGRDDRGRGVMGRE